MKQKEIRYVRANPTGNITCLVLSRVAREDRDRVTAALMAQCEQVGYLTIPSRPEARGRLEMMGGEFCGNASMAAAAYLARCAGIGPGEERSMELEVSGADHPVRCRIRREDGAWTGEVEMPGTAEVSPCRVEGRDMVRVRMEGILHLITEESLPAPEAEALLRRAARQEGAPAAGLLQWNAGGGFMRPLVYVPLSETMVWESGCGSGSTALGAWQAMLRGDGETVTEVRQPGGTIRVRTEICGGKPVRSTICGTVTLEDETRIMI